MITVVRIGTRGSPLALWQARTVASLLESRGGRIEILTIKTAGDRLQERPHAAAGTSGKGVFVKEIEDALLAGHIDVAVHSAKDMSAALPDGLTIAGVLPRADPRDALVVRDATAGRPFADLVARLGGSPLIATSSVRRSAQLSSLIADARFVPIRGNVDTRLRKLDAGDFNALVLAAAGMMRLGYAVRISAPIPVELCTPAPGQGIVAVETRADDRGVRTLIEPISDAAAAVCFDAERTLVSALGGGCQLPLGALAVPTAEGRIHMRAIVTSLDGHRSIRRDGEGAADRAADLGRRLADELAKAGAAAILDEVR
ncbi:MAG TPA: hydroxymethylbilane synthase [Vicinamibacterales bacterium]